MRSLPLIKKHQSYQPKRRQLPPPFAPISSPPRKFGSCQHLTLHHPLQPNLGIIKSSQKWHRTTFHVRHSQSVRNKGHVLNNKQNNVDIRHTIDVKLMYVDRLPSISMALHNINRRILQTFHLFHLFFSWLHTPNLQISTHTTSRFGFRSLGSPWRKSSEIRSPTSKSSRLCASARCSSLTTVGLMDFQSS